MVEISKNDVNAWFTITHHRSKYQSTLRENEGQKALIRKEVLNGYFLVSSSISLSYTVMAL